MHLRANTFEAFPAQLIERHNLFHSSGSVRAWSWQEVTYAPHGRFVPLDGGRVGTATANPAFELQHDYAAPGNIVWLQPGWNGEDHGQEWLFRCDCAGGSGSGGGGPDDAFLVSVPCCENAILSVLYAEFSNFSGCPCLSSPISTNLRYINIDPANSSWSNSRSDCWVGSVTLCGHELAIRLWCSVLPIETGTEGWALAMRYTDGCDGTATSPVADFTRLWSTDVQCAPLLIQSGIATASIPGSEGCGCTGGPGSSIQVLIME